MSDSYVPPAILAMLAAFGLACVLAALPIFRLPLSSRARSFPPLAPHPSQPGSMLSFVALPSFLILLTLARFGLLVAPVESLNSPDGRRRIALQPGDVKLDFEEDRQQLVYPRNTAALTVAAARRAESAAGAERIKGVKDLAWWTGVCPAYAPFTLPRLARALQDPDPRVIGAAVIGLGSTGAYGRPALPDLLAARGTSVRYLDHLITEATHLIRNTPAWPPAPECEDESTERLGAGVRQASRSSS